MAVPYDPFDIPARPSEKKIADIIENELRVVNQQGGVKADGAKVRPTLLFKSLHKSLSEVLAVLEFGAKKYAPDNWKKVEPHRYDDALLRHVMAYLSGEKNDPDSNLDHLAHAACCILFLLELRKNNEQGKADST